jgi:hypothetical protein
MTGLAPPQLAAVIPKGPLRAIGVLLSVLIALAGCENFPRIATVLEHVAPGSYAVGFMPCSGEWPLGIEEIRVYRLTRSLPENESARAALAYEVGTAWSKECHLSLSDYRSHARLNSNQRWIIGAPVRGYETAGACPKPSPHAIYKLWVHNRTTGPSAVTLVRIGPRGDVQVLWSSCEGHSICPAVVHTP